MNAMEAVESPPQPLRRPRLRVATEPRHFLEALRAGDREAAQELVERTYEQVYASLFRMSGDAELAADLTQETYARAWRALDKFEGRSRVSTWLYRIAYTTFLNHIRRPQRVSTLDEDAAADLESPRPLPEEELIER